MKKLFVIMIIFTIIMILGCGINLQSKKNIDVETERIKTVYSSPYERIFVDTETNVMYLYEGLGYGGGLTVMFDKDGKPLLWEGGDTE
jgi:hypothetical protein